MKNQLLILLTLIFLFSCKEKHSNRTPVQVQSTTYNLYGDAFETDSILSLNELSQKIEKIGDTLQLTLKGTIKEVCTKKGCWMTLSMENDSEMMVRFKDYGFFVPLDASGEVLIHGKAFISETSVDDLRHYAEDAGASDDEIAAITTPKTSYNFEADGVLISQ
ncbi:MAG: DUF4920 domain-containing protein [Flavobacteriaceae bacterium]|jgi:hypothetical protein